jgi:hypothetical protein
VFVPQHAEEEVIGTDDLAFGVRKQDADDVSLEQASEDQISPGVGSI